MKVAFVNTVEKKGGAAKIAWTLYKGLKTRGIQTSSFVREKSTDDSGVHIITNDKIDSSDMHKKNGYSSYDIQSTYLLSKNKEFLSSDLVHFHNLHGNYFNPFALPELTGVKPAVWTLHDMNSFTGHCAHSFECEKWKSGCGNCPDLKIFPPIPVDATKDVWANKNNIYSLSDFYVAVPSLWLKNKVHQSMLKEKEVELIYNGINTDVFRPWPKEKARKKLGLPSDGVILTFSAQGGIENRWRDRKCLLGVIDYFNRRKSGVYFLNIGSQGKPLNGENIFDVPFVNDEQILGLVYSAADVFLFPSLADNCPLVVIEAMSCGLPVVGYETGGVSELVESGRTGIITEYKNKEIFIKAVENIVQNEPKRQRFGIDARERAKKLFSSEVMIEKYLCLYEKAIEYYKAKNKNLAAKNKKLYSFGNLTQAHEKIKYSKTDNEKYLSVVVTSRNDNHGGNTLHRIQVFAKSFAEQCTRFNLDAELIIVDWNPPADKKRLYEVLEWPLDLGPLIVRFITVPKEIHNKIDNSDKFGLFQWIAKNVGIRRANGKFILSTNIDILFSDELIQFIASKQFNEDYFYRIDRHDVGCKRIPENLNTKGQLEFCNKNIIRIQGLYGAKSISEISSDDFRYTAEDARLHTNACGDFTLMARDKWHHFRGYPELGKGDLYIDGLIVHMAHVAGLKQVILQEPMRIYHIEHDEGWIARRDKNPIRKQLSLDYNKEYKSWCQKMLVQKCVITNNGKDWGYPESQFEEKKIRGRYKRDVSKNKDEKIAGDKRELFRTWIGTFAKAENRLYYRDQSSESLNTLANLVKEYKPTKIVELGTLSGMSLRTWLAASNNVEVIAVDLSFKGLYKSRELIPVDLTRVRLLEQDILKTDFLKLWSKDDRVIFYVDAHDLENVPIMKHVLDNVLPALPEGSCFVVDDLWYCPKTATNENVLGFFDKVTTNEVDSLQYFEGYYAPYWKGGFFIGFREVVPLLEWVNRHKVELEFVPGDKAVMFRHSFDSVNYFDEKFDKVHFDQQTGVMSYSPVDNVKAIGDDAAAQQANTLCQQGIELFEKGKTIQSLKCFRKAVSFTENIYGILYAQAACLVKAGQLDLAAKLLELELKQKMPHPRANIMLGDIERHLNKEKMPKPIEGKKKGLTIFTIPKAFRGHTEVIQRNAIKSWMAMEPTPEIILFGTDDGTVQVAQEFGLRHVSGIKCNEYGTPLIDDIFAQGQDLASNEIIAYVNADMILFDNFTASAKFIADRKQQFLMIGKRWDVDITDRLDFSENSWRQYVIDRIKSNGQLHGEFGIDYFVFKNGLWPKIPPFAIGRTTWDNWFVYEAIRLGHPVINVSGSVAAVHQNHDYGHLAGGKKEAWHGPEAQRNLALGGGQSCKRSIEHASLIFKDGKFIETIPLMTEYAQSLLKKGDIPFALKAFRKAAEIDSKSVVLHNDYASALQQVAEDDNTLKSFLNALKHDPSSRTTVLDMHRLCVKMGLSDQAKKVLSTYIQNNPQDKQIIDDSGNKDLDREMSSRGTGKKASREIVSIPPGSEADKINSVRYARGVGEDTGKIFVIPVKPEFMPATMAWPYPAHNDYYGVEQDFLAYLYTNNELVTHDWRKAKWHYLPVYWQHWMFLNDYGKKNLYLLDAELKRCIIDDTKTFTVCLYSNLSQVHIGRSILMLPSRNIDRGIDIPLLCTYHKLPQKLPPKRYLANFVGRLSTGDIRGKMIENLKGRNDVFLAESEAGTERFAQAMLESYIALSPRGYGGDSFRFYEAMQLGTTPFFIGDLDTRPFKSFIDWDQISLYAPDASNVSDIIDSISKERLMEMGKNASRVFAEKLCYQKWCAYALKELELIDSGLRQRQEILI